MSISSSALAPSRRALAAFLLLICGALSAVGLANPTAEAAPACPWLDPDESAETRAGQLVAAMTLDDKIQMVTGLGYFNPSSPNRHASGVIRGNPRLCIPDLVLNDSTAGIGFQQQHTTAFPQGITQASTWDRDLIGRFGEVLADEAMRKGVNVVLGPGINMARNPLYGRGFEYAGEDPYLAGRLSAEVIEGIQRRPVLATAKHFLLNEQEIDRTTNSSEADERTIREIYLPPFEDAVNSGVGAVMCGYNRVASLHSCKNPALLQGYLKGDLGFDGFVMSDWGAAHTTVPEALAGMDMEMPGDGILGVSEMSPAKWGERLKAAVESGEVPVSRLDDMVRRILRPMFRGGLFEHPPLPGSEAGQARSTTPESIATATKIAQDGSVLLKNQRDLLPLRGAGKRIALIGTPAAPLGAQLASQGYGSHHVPVFGLDPDVVPPLSAIRARAARDGSTVSYNDGTVPLLAAATARTADVAVVFVSDANTEMNDRPDLRPRQAVCNPILAFTQTPNFPVCIPLPTNQDALVAAVADANPNTVVVLQNGGPLEMPWLDAVPSVVENWYPGEVDGDALAGLLFGDVNFSGRLPVTFPQRLVDGPIRSVEQYPGVKDADGVPHSTYSEGLLIGYRWYDDQGIEPLFPFGHGLSYTTFAYSGLEIRRRATGATVRAQVTNTGSRTGAEVAQLYLAFPEEAGEPPLQLKGFEKVELDPGETRTVTFELDRRAFSIWDTAADDWRVVPGCYGVRVGGSSRDLPLSGSVDRGRGRGRC
ncbi:MULTISPECIES: beta-glucosidase family protein [Nocardioides]|uniref:Probable beta-glucosidase G n=1 Tax=Nocardioides vastitatis TaxID=2568655 RepID=A0ABW0ZJ11_9ACTN|nr:glycoside hydrolase family 3 C-terminal domain-containing protein [Nocardioides sp.]THI96608.1 glycosyl hydrolase [Nocardioides sp.]